MNLAPIVRSQNVGPLTLYRADPPAQNEFGGFDDSSPDTLELNPVAVHTLGGRDLEQLPEADRNTETIQLHTLERLYVADGDKSPDRVVYQDRTYRVIRVEDYSQQGGVWISLAALEED